MNLFKLFAALLSATASTPALSETLRRQACHNHVSSRGKRTGAANQSCCLHNYSADEIDCSYVDRSQCAATASGGSANVHRTPYGKLHARAAGPPISGRRHGKSLVQTPSLDRRRTASAAWPQRGSVFHQGRIEKTFNLHPPCRSTSTAVAGQGRLSVACRTERLGARIIANLDFMDFKQASSIPIPASAMP
jgi:hypothetical protein